MTHTSSFTLGIVCVLFWAACALAWPWDSSETHNLPAGTYAEGSPAKIQGAMQICLNHGIYNHPASDIEQWPNGWEPGFEDVCNEIQRRWEAWLDAEVERMTAESQAAKIIQDASDLRSLHEFLGR